MLPNAFILFYLNRWSNGSDHLACSLSAPCSVMDWQYYQLHRFMQQDPSRWLHNKDGSVASINNQSIFDFTRDDVIGAWELLVGHTHPPSLY